jgi:hypothetical protein
VAAFLVLGGPALLLGFLVALVVPGRLPAAAGALGLLAALVLGLVTDSTREPPLSLVLALWSVALLLGAGLAGMTLGVGWLWGLRVHDE